MLEKECVYNLRNRNVQRMLWPVDHEQIRIDLKNEQLKMKKEMITKYNFDFDSEKPLGGRYQWEPVAVDPQEESPISSPILLKTNEEGASTSSTRTCRVLSKQGQDQNKKKSQRRTYVRCSKTRTRTSTIDTIPCKIKKTGKIEKRKIKGSDSKIKDNSNLSVKHSRRLRSSSTSVSGC